MKDYLASIASHVRVREDFGVPRWKRAIDLTCILLALPALLPVMLVIALGIKLVSRGPVFFSQERVGHHARRFKCWKFRSMKPGADARIHQGHTAFLMRTARP